MSEHGVITSQLAADFIVILSCHGRSKACNYTISINLWKVGRYLPLILFVFFSFLPPSLCGGQDQPAGKLLSALGMKRKYAGGPTEARFSATFCLKNYKKALKIEKSEKDTLHSATSSMRWFYILCIGETRSRGNLGSKRDQTFELRQNTMTVTETRIGHPQIRRRHKEATPSLFGSCILNLPAHRKGRSMSWIWAHAQLMEPLDHHMFSVYSARCECAIYLSSMNAESICVTIWLAGFY
jgi:hypothetical protein